MFHRVTGRVAATQKAEQKWPTKRRSRRQIFRAVDDNGLIKSAAPSREDLPRSSDVATTPTPISLLPLNKTNWLTSLSFLRPVSFAKRRLDELVPEPTDNEFARNEFAQEIRGEGERGCPPFALNQPTTVSNEVSTNSFQTRICIPIFLTLVRFRSALLRFVTEGSKGGLEGRIGNPFEIF